MVAEGTIGEDEYLQKLEGFITKATNSCKTPDNYAPLSRMFALVDMCYPKG
jgi:hypothetical protein